MEVMPVAVIVMMRRRRELRTRSLQRAHGSAALVPTSLNQNAAIQCVAGYLDSLLGAANCCLLAFSASTNRDDRNRDQRLHQRGGNDSTMPRSAVS